MHAPKSYIIVFPLHDQRENWSDFPLFSAGDKARTTGAARVAAAAECTD